MHTVLKFLSCGWLISENIAHFSTCRITLIFEKFEQNCRYQKLQETFSISEVLSILRLVNVFYIIYIKKIFDWSKNE